MEKKPVVFRVGGLYHFVKKGSPFSWDFIAEIVSITTENSLTRPELRFIRGTGPYSRGTHFFDFESPLGLSARYYYDFQAELEEIIND